MKRKASFPFAFLSFFRNFVRIRRISLNKGSLGIWGKTRLRFGDRTQFHVLLQIAQCARLCRLPFMGQNYSIYSNLAYIFPKKNAAALRGAQRLRCVESMGTGCLMWIPKLNQNLSPWLRLSVPDIAAAALIAYANLLAAVEAGGADATCLADYQQVCLML